MIFNRISIDGFGIIGNKVTINFPTDGKIGISGNGATKYIETTQFGKKKFGSSMTFPNL